MKLFYIISMILISNIVILTGLAFGENQEREIEWVDPQEKTLSLLEHFTRYNFIIEASDFYDNSALITIYKIENFNNFNSYGIYDNNNNFNKYGQNKVVSQVIARIGDSYNITENNISRMNIEILDLKEIKGNISAYEGLNVIVDQRVKIRTKLAGIPIPRLSIIPKERKLNNRTFIDRIFTPGSEISINFSIKNEGKATLRSVHLIINKSDIKELPFLFPGENIDRELPELKANESNTINIRFRAPFVAPKRKNFTISANVTGKDIFGREYIATDSTFIIVKPFVEKVIEIKKFVPEKMYMGDFVYITLNIKNNGFDNISINLTEKIPTGFISLDDYNFWNNLSNFTLNGQSTKIILYKFKPIRPGIYIFPENSSIVSWREKNGIEYNIENNTEIHKLIVNGPYVELKKSGIIEGDNININIEARNFGDMTAIVRLKDFINQNQTIYQSLVVRPGGLTSTTYTINKADLNISNISDGKIILPSAEATVLDQYLYTNERYTQKALSNELILYFT